VEESAVRGIHFIQEDSPDEIGVALWEFVTAVPDQNPRPARR
jgi:hypothetical protein